MTSILVITGPTAVGKSSLTMELASRLGGEIVCCDSMQVYRRLDIGTAKPTRSDQEAVRHHCLDIAEPSERFSVSEYIDNADSAIQDIISRNRLPIICGGTGFFVKGLLYEQSYCGIDGDMALRARLEMRSNESLYNELLSVDAKSAGCIHANDTKRIIRALEVYLLSGRIKSSLEDGELVPRYDFRLVGIDCDRQELYNRIDNRVDKMIALGLEEEVRGLLKYKDCQSMQAIGYKQFVSYFDGYASMDDTISLIKQKSRNYAKRQWTFLKKIAGIEWMSVDEARLSLISR